MKLMFWNESPLIPSVGIMTGAINLPLVVLIIHQFAVIATVFNIIAKCFVKGLGN
jgi:hypothetical protein